MVAVAGVVVVTVTVFEYEAIELPVESAARILVNELDG